MSGRHSPFKRISRRVRCQAFRVLGLRRRSDLLYVRLLDGWLSRKEIELLYDTVLDLPEEGSIAEVGSYKGKSTVTMGLAVRRSGRSDVVYAIDHHEGSEEYRGEGQPAPSTWTEFQRTIREAGVEDLVEPLKMSSLDGARRLAERNVRLKLLFLDGAHDEQSVVADLEAYFPLLLPGGLIAMDDALPDGPCPGVYRAYERTIKARSEVVRWASGVLLVRKQLPAEGAPSERGA